VQRRTIINDKLYDDGGGGGGGSSSISYIPT
jgi:hypothetical protein